MSGNDNVPVNVLLDDEDREWAEGWKWYVNASGYVVRGRRKSDPPGSVCSVRMHRVILERKLGRPIKPGMVCDHINSVKTDNRRCNLREVTTQQNAFNQPRAKGYYFHKPSGKWMAYIRINAKLINLGYFEMEQEARAAYEQAKAIYHII